MRRIAGTAFLVLLLGLSVPARADVSDDDLAKARAERERVSAELNAAASAYDQALTTLETTKADIERTVAAVVGTQQRYDAMRAVVARRAVAAYKGEHAFQLGAVLASRDLNDLVDRAAYLERTSASDNAAIDRLRVAGIDLRDRKAELAGLEAQQDQDARRAQAIQRDLEAKLEAARSQEDTLIARRAAEDEARRRAAEAEAAREAAVAHGRTGSSGPALGVVCPVGGAVAFSDDFGEPRAGHTHQGNDMFASRGTPVVAARSGSVSEQEGGAGGNMIFLSAGGDVFMYAHLDSFTVPDGAYVSAGQQIGTVGSTGNVDADATHLHFEVHPSGGTAVDPFPTISGAC